MLAVGEAGCVPDDWDGEGVSDIGDVIDGLMSMDNVDDRSRDVVGDVIGDDDAMEDVVNDGDGERVSNNEKKVDGMRNDVDDD